MNCISSIAYYSALQLAALIWNTRICNLLLREKWVITDFWKLAWTWCLQQPQFWICIYHLHKNIFVKWLTRSTAAEMCMLHCDRHSSWVFSVLYPKVFFFYGWKSGVYKLTEVRSVSISIKPLHFIVIGYNISYKMMKKKFFDGKKIRNSVFLSFSYDENNKNTFLCSDQ